MSSAETTIERTVTTTHSTPVRVWLTLLKHQLRLIWPSSLIWIIGLVFTSWLVVGVYQDTFPTAQDRAALALSIEGNPAFEAMFGKATALDTVEGFAMWRAGGPLFPVIVIWGILVATRLARSEEDKGHDELLLGGVLSRRALILATIAALLIVIGVFILATGLILSAVTEISSAGAWRYAFAMAGGFTFFAGLGLLLVQFTTNRGAGLRIGLGIIGAAFALRILSTADATSDWLPWLTPFGWFSETGPPGVGSDLSFLLFAIGTISAGVLAVALNGTREIHGSLLLGEKETSDTHHSPYESLWKHELTLSRSSIFGFAGVGLFLTMFFGLISSDFVDFIDDFPAFAEVLAQFGLDDPTNASAYIGLIAVMLVLVVTLFAAGHAAAMREDEASGRLAVLLILPLERHRWLLTNALVGLLGIVIIAVAVGIGAMIGTMIAGTAIGPGDALLTALNLMPLGILFAGIGILIFGVVPSLTAPLNYVVMLTSYLLVLLDGFLDIPEWTVKISPFNYLALVPGESMNLLASGIFIGVGLIAAVIGAIAFRRRDLLMD
jgi:ABC-2 type transport system permease protein